LIDYKNRLSCTKYVSAEHLKGVLLDTKIREAFIIIAAFHEETLIDAYFINNLLCRYNSMVILPDRGKLSAALGHVLRPVRTFYGDSDLSVLNPLHKKGHHRQHRLPHLRSCIMDILIICHCL